MKDDVEAPAAGICERFAVKEVGIKDTSIWVQQPLSGSLTMVKQVKCHKSAAVSL